MDVDADVDVDVSVCNVCAATARRGAGKALRVGRQVRRYALLSKALRRRTRESEVVRKWQKWCRS